MTRERGAGPVGTLVELFADTVARHPTRPAVSGDGRRLHYAELDRLADRVASVLRVHGVRGGDHVAFLLDRGVDVFVAMLGILRAGAAYVPLDPRHPDARRDLMVTASGASLLLTQPGLVPRPTTSAIPVVELDVDAPAAEPPASAAVAAAVAASAPGSTPAPVAPPAPGVDPAQAAAVLFTSGSTGVPKAIVLQHRNIASFAGDPVLPALSPQDRVGHVSSVSFDAFHYEAWCAFAAGAAIVVLPTMAELVHGDLRRELRRRRITVLLAPTMAVNHVVREDREAFSALRVLCTGGDVISPAACRELLAGGFRGEFVNLYGPTEGTTACTAHRITDDDTRADTIPIGRELAGARCHVLDERLAESPPGTPGELYIGGAGVSRGYLGQPALTAQRYLPDPFGQAGARMYATGDVVRRRDDGVLEYLGRADDQVKIRGYRVEPREVERGLGRHPAVREVAVIVSGDGGDRHLVALVVCDDPVSPKELREHAAAVLPEFMVPSAFALVPEIPANDHGKRDLDALAALATDHLRRAANQVAPRDDVERYLVELWEDLLAVEQVGSTDDFFALGGNSLLAFRVQRRINRELGVPLEPRDVLANSELGALAALIRDRGGSVV